MEMDNTEPDQPHEAIVETIAVQQPPPPQEEVPTEEIVTREIIKKILTKHNKDAELDHHTVTLGTKAGDNYMSVIYSVGIYFKENNANGKGDLEKIDIMLKTMPRNELRVKELIEMGAFTKEGNMYRNVLPGMITFQEKKGLKGEEIYRGWPVCYDTFHNGTTDYLAIEDLRGHGYTMADRIKGLDTVKIHLVLQSMARFHAISFAQFGGDWDKIMATYPWLEERMFPTPEKLPETMSSWVKSMFSTEAEVVRKEGFTKEADMMESICGGEDSTAFWRGFNELVGGKRVKNAVINHGDCWTNNVLFKGESEVMLIDFQLSRCASRCIDLGYMLHSSIPMEVFNEGEEEFVKCYWIEFITFLKDKLGVDKKETWEEFKEEYYHCKFYGVVLGFLLAPLLSADGSDLPDLEGITEADYEEDGVKKMLDGVMGGKGDSAQKICNLATKHLPRCWQMKRSK